MDTSAIRALEARYEAEIADLREQLEVSADTVRAPKHPAPEVLDAMHGAGDDATLCAQEEPFAVVYRALVVAWLNRAAATDSADQFTHLRATPEDLKMYGAIAAPLLAPAVPNAEFVAGFGAGWNASGEGFNSDYPGCFDERRADLIADAWDGRSA